MPWNFWDGCCKRRGALGTGMSGSKPSRVFEGFYGFYGFSPAFSGF